MRGLPPRSWIEDALRRSLGSHGPTNTVRALLEDALAVCFAFNVTDRLADAFDFEVVSADAMDAGARYLLSRGYR